MITLSILDSSPPAAAAVLLHVTARRLPPASLSVGCLSYSHKLEPQRSLGGPHVARPRGLLYGPPVPPVLNGGAFSSPAPTRPVPHAPGPAGPPPGYGVSRFSWGPGKACAFQPPSLMARRLSILLVSHPAGHRALPFCAPSPLLRRVRPGLTSAGPLRRRQCASSGAPFAPVRRLRRQVQTAVTGWGHRPRLPPARPGRGPPPETPGRGCRSRVPAPGPRLPCSPRALPLCARRPARVLLRALPPGWGPGKNQYHVVHSTTWPSSQEPRATTASAASSAASSTSARGSASWLELETSQSRTRASKLSAAWQRCTRWLRCGPTP